MTRQFRSGCPIASTLDMVGDRWSLVILRDLLTGKTRFSQFLDSPERISPSVLSDRLAFLESDGLVAKTAYSQRPTRYEFRVTPKGEAMLPILQAMCRWGHAHVPGAWEAPTSFMRRRVVASSRASRR